MNQTEWVSLKEAAAMLDLCKQAILKWCMKGQLESSKVGYNVIRISTASIWQRYITTGKMSRD